VATESRHVLSAASQSQGKSEGASLRLFLTERGGLGESDVRDLWKLRQVVHGANVFTAARLEMLWRLTPSLQAAVLLLLKAALGDPRDKAPAIIPADGPILGHQISLFGDRVVEDSDVEIVRFLESLNRGHEESHLGRGHQVG